MFYKFISLLIRKLKSLRNLLNIFEVEESLGTKLKNLNLFVSFKIKRFIRRKS